MNLLSKQLKNSVKYLENSFKKSEKWNLNYHLTPPTGWLNDPNGLSYFKGEYHIFFQYSPYSAKGALKFWGHYKSKDFINWEYLGTPIIPDQNFDCHGVYSGSTLIENDKMYIYYTGNVKYIGEDYDYITNGRGSNTILAISNDGINIDSKKCVMTNKDYPSYLTCHVRDPKVWKENSIYYMVQGARTKEDIGIVLLFESKDKVTWTLKNTIKSKEKFGFMWECPDLFKLQNNTILFISPQGVDEEDYKYQNIYQSGYYILEGDFKTQNYTLNEFTEIDRGFDFYAPQTFLDKKGRRILVAWMGLPDCDHMYTNKTIDLGWQHALTIPRVLKIKNYKIYQEPIEELQLLRKSKIELQSGKSYTISPCFELFIEQIKDDIKVNIEDSISIEYKSKENLFTLNFENDIIGAGRTKRAVELNNCKNLRIFVDKSSIEIFINDGEEVFSTRFYPENEFISIKINNDTKNTLWEMGSFNINLK